MLPSLLLTLLACEAQEYTPGDWEVDIVSDVPAAAETVRVCIEGVGVSTIGAGNGRVAVRGLPPTDTRVRLEVQDIDGATVLSTDWLDIGDEAPAVSASPVAVAATPCTASGSFAEAGAEDRLLVARFVME